MCLDVYMIVQVEERGRAFLSRKKKKSSLIVEVKPTPLKHFHTVSLLQLQID